MLKSKLRRSLLTVLSGLSLVLLVPGCATSPADTDGWRDSQRQILKSRAEARWAALIARDIDKAYGYLSPDYRSVVTVQQYQRKFGRSVDWRLARVSDIRYDSPTVASVSLGVTYQIVLPGSGLVENNRFMIEKWLYKDGGWWYTDE